MFKTKKTKAVTYTEVDGMRYAIDLGCLVELAKAYNERYSEDVGIEEVLVKCYKHEKLTVEALDKLVFAITFSANYYSERVGEKLMTEEDYFEIQKEKGLPNLVNVAHEIIKAQVKSIVGNEELPMFNENETEEKKS